MMQLENSTVRRDVRSWEWDRFDEVVDDYLAIDDGDVEDDYIDLDYTEEVFLDDFEQR